SSIAESLISVNQIQEICLKSGKQLVVYISMGFGNPYGDPWSTEVAEKWVAEMDKLGVKTISLSDTIGIANPESISYLFSNLIPAFPHIEFGAHLHTTPQTWHEKIDAAYTSGCKRFDGALKGYGGCPMATDKLTGNMATENLLAYFNQKNEQTNIQEENFNSSMLIAKQLFSEYH
ncbi:MAG: hydroxymethylglutaryl-CoA lyase, partial [Bacteroidota bacterium]